MDYAHIFVTKFSSYCLHLLRVLLRVVLLLLIFFDLVLSCWTYCTVFYYRLPGRFFIQFPEEEQRNALTLVSRYWRSTSFAFKVDRVYTYIHGLW